MSTWLADVRRDSRSKAKADESFEEEAWTDYYEMRLKNYLVKTTNDNIAEEFATRGLLELDHENGLILFVGAPPLNGQLNQEEAPKSPVAITKEAPVGKNKEKGSSQGCSQIACWKEEGGSKITCWKEQGGSEITPAKEEEGSKITCCNEEGDS